MENTAIMLNLTVQEATDLAYLLGRGYQSDTVETYPVYHRLVEELEHATGKTIWRLHEGYNIELNVNDVNFPPLDGGWRLHREVS